MQISLTTAKVESKGGINELTERAEREQKVVIRADKVASCMKVFD